MKFPPGPDSPAAQQLVQFLADPIKFMEGNAKGYGDIFTSVDLRSNPVIVVSNPQGIAQIAQADDDNKLESVGKPILKSFLGEHSLLTTTGDKRQRLRKLSMPPFHGENIERYGLDIVQLTEQNLNNLKLGQPIVIDNFISELVLEIILKVALGLEDPQHHSPTYQAISFLLSFIKSPLNTSLFMVPALQVDLGAWSPWGNFLRRREQMDEEIYRQIQVVRAEKNQLGQNILNLLLAAQDEKGQALSQAELRDELVTIIHGAHGPTIAPILWGLYWLHQNPASREQIAQELSHLGPEPNPLDICRLPYLGAFCQETLRIYPTIVTPPREVLAPMSLMGYDLEPGQRVVINIYLTHQRQDLYPEPQQFRPQRFLEKQFSPHEYLPFGGGRSKCMGDALGLMIMKLVLATFISRYRFTLLENDPIAPQLQGSTLIPAKEIKLSLDRSQGL